MSTQFCPEIVNNLLTIHFSRRKTAETKPAARAMKPERQAAVDSIPPAKAGVTLKSRTLRPNQADLASSCTTTTAYKIS